MKVLVLWEDPKEADDAQRLAEVLASLAPSFLMDAEVDDKGNVTIHHGRGPGLRRAVWVRACSMKDHFDQLMRSLLEV